MTAGTTQVETEYAVQFNTTLSVSCRSLVRITGDERKITHEEVHDDE